jgi:transcription initiation factor TFIIIB Brf1 subunit/transcription initiation factor TFIIB
MVESLHSKAWEQLESIRELASEESIVRGPIDICSECKRNDFIEVNFETTCLHCGLVFSSNFISSDAQHNYEDYSSEIYTKKKIVNKNCKLQKMQQWYMWTNDEKSDYKLAGYTKALCAKLRLSETVYESITNTVICVMNVIKKFEGTKRAKVKDGIILVCIQYVLEQHNCEVKMTSSDLAKRINLDQRYVTKGEKLVLELINNNRINLDKKTLLNIKHPMEYVLHVNKKHNLRLPLSLLDQVEKLVQICDDNDILLDHTPLAIGVSCLYFILKEKGIEVDLKVFSSINDLSIVTITKTYNKLRKVIGASQL